MSEQITDEMVEQSAAAMALLDGVVYERLNRETQVQNYVGQARHILEAGLAGQAVGPTAEPGWPGPRPDGRMRSSSAALESITRLLDQTDGTFLLRTAVEGGYQAEIRPDLLPAPAPCAHGSNPAEAIERMLRQANR